MVQHLKKFNQSKEAMFFHDLVNLTHGLILFLDQRKQSKRNIDINEIEILEQEVRSLQSLVKDHYQFSHKNLESTYEWVSFAVAEQCLSHLLKTYFSDETIKTYIQLKGALSYECSIEERESVLIYYPTFYRIMNNLIKNMAEAHCSQITFIFDYQQSGLIIETSNDFLAENSSRTIDSSTGVGIGSIASIVNENGGNFTTKSSENIWINHIFPPKPSFNKAA